MEETSAVGLIGRIQERLDAVERHLLKPEPSGLPTLMDNLEQSAAKLAELERLARIMAASDWPGEGELPRKVEGLQARVKTIEMLIESAGSLLQGWQAVALGGYSSDGQAAVLGHSGSLLSREG